MCCDASRPFGRALIRISVSREMRLVALGSGEERRENRDLIWNDVCKVLSVM